MTNLRNDENVFVRNLTKIGTEENKAIYSRSPQRSVYLNREKNQKLWQDRHTGQYT